MSTEASDSCLSSAALVGATDPYEREHSLRDRKIMVLTPWTVQNIGYEVIKNYMIGNSPQSQGCTFTQQYHPDELQSDISLEIAFHYKDSVVQKRPGIYVSRGQADYKFPTLGQTIGGGRPQESEKARFALVTMPINITVVGTNVGFTEQLAEFIFKIFLMHQATIKSDFCLHEFKLVSVSAPNLYLESKEHFAVSITILAAFIMGGVVKGDHLKLKTMSYDVFTNCAEASTLAQ